MMPMGKYRKNVLVVCSSVLFFALCVFWLHGAVAEFNVAPLQDIEEMDPSRESGTWSMGSFTPLPGGIINLPSFRNSRFFRIPLRSLNLSGAASADRSFREVLLLPNPHITEVEAFALHANRNTYTRYVFHNSLTVSDMPLPMRYPALLMSPLNRDPSVEDYLYLKVQSDYPLSSGVYLLDEPGFMRLYMKTSLYYVIFFAAILSFVIAYLFLFAMTGEKAYFRALLHQVCLSFLALTFNRNLQIYWNLSFTVLTGMTWAAYSLFHISVTYGYTQRLRDQIFGRRLSWAVFCVQLLLAPLLLWAVFQATYFWAFVVVATMAACSIAAFVPVAVSMYRKKKRHGELFFLVSANVVLYSGFAGLFATVFHPGILSAVDTFSLSAFVLAPAFYSCFLFIQTQERFHKSFALETQNSFYRQLGRQDPATGLFNKTYLEYALEENIKNALITERGFSLILIDIDHLKHYNEAWGRQEGERALELVARTIQECLREHDVAARCEEAVFGVVLHGVALPVAQLVAERIRISCAERSFSLGEGKELTVSLGIVLFHPNDTPQSLLLRAEEALYQAKKLGHNRTEIRD